MIQVCRLCSCTSSPENLINIFSKDDENVQYITKIKSCVPILIYRTDPLSKFICLSCGSKIDEFYKFKAIIVENNNKAIDQLRTLENQNGVQLYLNSLESYNASLEDSKSTSNEKEFSAASPASISSKISLTSDLQILPNEHDSTCISSLSSKQPLLKILTPMNINSSLTLKNDSNDNAIDTNNLLEAHHHSANRSIRHKLTASKSPVRHQPQTLLQLALHTINLSINPNYAAADKLKRKLLLKKRDFIHSERKWKLSSSSKSGNKRTFDECRPILANLLTSWRPPIKQIKLESVLPLAPEICISLNKSNHDSKHSDGLDVRLKYPQNRCRYCFKDFCDIQQLALHEASFHIQVFIGARIDSDSWRDYEENMEIRNKWIKRKEACAASNSNIYIKEELFSDDEMINNDIDDEEDEEQVVNGSINEVDKPVEEPEFHRMEPLDVEEGKVGNTPFHELSKKERFQYYKIVYESGLKRRQCPFCKRSFKDSWSVDDHILKNRCRLVCPFCGKYFPKDDNNTDIFYLHLVKHKDAPNFDSMTERWRKNIARAQQLVQNQMRMRMARLYQQKNIRIEPLKMKYLLTSQSSDMVPQIKTEPGTVVNPAQLLELQYNSSTMPDPRRSTKPYRSYYCRNCFRVFYQEQDLSNHFPNCDQADNDPNGIDMMMEGNDYSYSSPSQDADSSAKQVFRCGFCPAVFYNSNARNSHMRVHKEKLFSSMAQQNPIMLATSQQQAQYRPLQPILPKPNPTRIIDENLARLAQNPHITIKPSGSMKKPMSAESSMEMSSPSNNYTQYNHLPKHLEPFVITTEGKNYQCHPCGNSFPSQKALYGHKRTCPMIPHAASTPTNPPATSQTGQQVPVRKFRCTACNKRFMTKANLAFHRNNICKRIKFLECPFCKRKFSTESQYTNHILYNHPE